MSLAQREVKSTKAALPAILNFVDSK